MSDFYFLFVKAQSDVHPIEATDVFWLCSICECMALVVVYIYLFISNGVDRREWRNLKTVTEKSDFVSKAAMRDEISNGGCACVCTLSGEACVGTASSHFKNVCVAEATSQVTFHPSGEPSCTGNIPRWPQRWEGCFLNAFLHSKKSNFQVEISENH